MRVGSGHLPAQLGEATALLATGGLRVVEVRAE
jgi:hypothetical protein